ncbi:MAG: hypothetical protein HFI44_12390 [Lachnospiraceae bacterium]|nr:hypothetical protein [Lachnospiraceae bacterium]GFI01403.1 hypothetical protein IMSAGC005_00225 [Lachnospiraceae bacterium]
MKKIYEVALILIGTVGWWGFVYPDMCLTEDVYEQEYEEDEQLEVSVTDAAADIETVQSGIQIGSIRIKSRLVEYLYQER